MLLGGVEMDQETMLYDLNSSDSMTTEKKMEDEKGRSKTALRMKYEAECQVIRKKLGGLEDIRKNLGMTQRKMCQLLMVDPSAWSRWQKNEDQIPPHIYRSLQWYLALIEKAPEWHPMNAYLGSFRPVTTSNNKEGIPLQEQIYDIQRQLKSTLNHNHLFLEEIRKQTQIHWGWKLVFLLNLAAWIYNMIF